MFKSVALLKIVYPVVRVGFVPEKSYQIFSQHIRRMTSLSSVPLVDIDPSGVFKYILLKVYEEGKNGQEPEITIVRGYKRCEYHADIYDEVQAKLNPLDCEPLGGGRISHDPDNKKIHIYGYSQGYGKADHEIAAKLVKGAYPEYTISISDEGY
ncbi:14 kDa phosphohistidine phosphatase-like isoform X1 [Colias croceus]|uniref:14 kDa phosphohistidine phosphatase-like isoform X1 n=2 Tax=Colias crocea TaxID=72248 RepID=UPI001E27ABA9|nr:14 kDa phosphohistidine phosphatase-like isoform X1 [Colias croceus]